MLPGQKRAITGAGYRGLARQPSGAVIVIGRNSPELAGTLPWRSESSRIERIVRYAAMSTVPSNGMFSGRSICGDVPVRSTWISEPVTLTRALMRRSRLAGFGSSWKPSMNPSAS